MTPTPISVYTINDMRQRYVVQVVPEEKQPVESVVSSVPPVVSVFSPAVSDLKLRQEQVDPEAEQLRRQQAVQELLREDIVKKEPITIAKPRAPKRLQETEEGGGKEAAFRRHLAQPNQTERIERLYQRREPEKGTKTKTEVKKKAGFSLPKLPSLLKHPKTAAVVVVVLLLFFSSLLGGALYVRADVGSTEGEARSLLTDLQENRLVSARERLQLLEEKRDRYQVFYRRIRPVFRLIQGKEKANHIDQLFEVSGSGLHVMKTGLESYGVLERGYHQFLGQEEGKSTETFSAVAGQLEVLFTELSALQAQVQRLGNPYHLSAITELKTGLNERVPQLRKYFLSAQQLSYVLPEIIGEGGQKKQYLVLLQNNAELRATGGFIGSFALITVENGKFVDFRVEDVYEADGQLNGYVAPPEEITQYLGEAQWFLRDVNWSPDFPTVAAQAAWFLDKELHIKPDGVIGLNLAVVQKLLEVTGPVNLVDYNEVITKENLYERAQQHAELNFFPGSTQKRDFLSAVAGALFDRLMREDTNKMLIMKAFLQAADQSELLISITQPQASEALANLGWDGALRTPDCPHPFPNQSCFVDTVMQVEANVGVNKSNQFIKRSIKHDVVVSGNEARHERTVVLQNTADSNAWPEGSYKSYFRLFTTAGAQLSAVTINGTPVDLRSVSVKEEKGKAVFGFLVNVPIKTTYTIQVAYTVGIPEGSPLVYALFEQKQPGAGNDSLDTSITIEDREVLTVAPEPEISGRTMRFSADHQTHQFFAVETR